MIEEEEKSAKSKSLFTAAQFQELQLQAVIFKYIFSGLPVPFHLFFIIWSSVSSSLVDGGIYKLYPTCKVRLLNLSFLILCLLIPSRKIASLLVLFLPLHMISFPCSVSFISQIGAVYSRLCFLCLVELLLNC